MSDDELAARVAAALEPEPVADAWPVSRRQALVALASLGGLASVDSASAQAGSVSAETAFFSNYDSASTASGYDLTIDGDTFSFDGSDEIGLPDGSVGAEVVTPDGGASEVIGPDGSVVWEDPTPDSLVHLYQADALSLSDGDAVQTWQDSVGGADLSGTPPTFQTDVQNGLPVIRFDGSDDSLYSSINAISPPYTLGAVIEYRGDIDVVANDQTPRIAELGEGYQITNFGDNISAGSTPSIGDFSIVFVVFRADGSNEELVLRVNQLEVSASDGGTDAEKTWDTVVAGSRAPDAFESEVGLGELLFYDADLTQTGELTQEEQRLSDKWGITI